MWISGKNPLREALKKGKNVEKVLISEGVRIPNDIMKLLRERGVPFERVKEEKLVDIAGTKHQGIVALLSEVKIYDPYEVMEETIKKEGYMVVLDGIEDPGNMGNIIRTSVMMGASGIIVRKRRSAPLTETVVRRSAGAVFHTKIAKVSNLRYFLEKFRERGGFIYSLELGGKPLSTVRFKFPLALIVGSEGRGVSKLLLKISHEIVTIEEEEGVGSLNVASATAIALYSIYLSLKGK